MSFKAGDKIKVTAKNSQYEGQTGEVVYVYEQEAGSIIECSEFGNGNAVIPFMESDLELVDAGREALIELAETLDKARLQANAIEETAPQYWVYGKIVIALVDTLTLITREYTKAQDVYQHIRDGNTVREAIASVVK